MKEKLQKINSALKFSILAIVCIIIFSFAITPVTLQNDTFYTLKIGEHILNSGEIDMMDPFSWHEDLQYVYPHWAYDVFMYLIYSAFGMTGIYVLTCILSATLGVTLYKVNCKLAKNQLISFLITLGAMYLLKGYIAARAQLVTFILFILAIYFIERFLETKKKRYGVALVIIPFLIANIHLAVWPFYFILFLPYIVEYLWVKITDVVIIKERRIKHIEKKIDKLMSKEGQQEKIEDLRKTIQEEKKKIERIKKKKEEEKKNSYKIIVDTNNAVKWLFIIILLAALTGFLTPLGTTPYTYLIYTLQGTTTQNISEHLPMVLGENNQCLIVLIILLAILIFTKVKIRLRDFFMLAGLAYLMILSRRQFSMFVLIGSVILNKLIYELCNKYDEGGIKQVYDFMLTKVGMFLTIAVVLILSMYFYKPKIKDQYINDNSYPVAACDFILENLDLEKVKFYNEYNYGSYMILRGIPVFIDSRADLYAPEFNTQTGNAEDGRDIFMDFINTGGMNKYYGDTFEEYGITHVILKKNSKMSNFIEKSADQDKYEQIYSDDNFVIYEIKEE